MVAAKVAQPPVAAAVVDAPKEVCDGSLAALGPGLSASRVALADKPVAGTPCLDVVRADLARYRLRVLTQARDGTPRTAPGWRDTFELAAVTNAGMFHDTGRPVGLLVENGFAVGTDNARLGGVLAFDPRSPDDPPALITGRDCDGFDLAALRERYRSLVQASRLLGCDGAPLHWADTKHYSASVIALDRAGRVVFVHARAALTMTELARELGSLDLAGALFLEGGPEASLVARGSWGSLERMGSYETAFWENDDNRDFWKLPNVIALEAR